MSSDLWDAFGSGHGRQPSKPDTESSVNDDDDFGDFEDPEVHDLKPSASTKDGQLLDLSGNAEALPAGSSVLFDAEETAQDDLNTIDVSNGFPPKDTGVQNKPQPRSMDRVPRKSVEDWGEFEGGTVLFDVDEVQNESNNGKKEQEMKQEEQEQQRLQWLDWNDTSDYNAADDWRAAEDTQNPLVPSPAKSILPSVRAASAKPTPAVFTKPKEPGPPPTNIPPPSILLAFITSMLHTLPSELKAVLPQAPTSVDQTQSLGPHIRGQLQRHFAVIHASTRIIAGRKLRWKRDTILSQSMKIGPAGSGGAKVGNLDKSESLREDLEVGEALEVWRRQRGLLRSITAKANAQAPGLDLMLPDTAEMMPVRHGKAGEGALTAPKSCFLCGINRDERVAKLDLFVEDSFGEWWMEHWGHVDCVIFWEECQSKLPQR